VDYIVLLVFVVLANLVFWGAIVYLFFRILRSESGTTQEKMNVITRIANAISGKSAASEQARERELRAGIAKH